MHLDLTDDQELIRDSISRLLAKTSGPEEVRAAEETGFDPVLWDALVEMGIPAMTLPEGLAISSAMLRR